MFPLCRFPPALYSQVVLKTPPVQIQSCALPGGHSRLWDKGKVSTCYFQGLFQGPVHSAELIFVFNTEMASKSATQNFVWIRGQNFQLASRSCLQLAHHTHPPKRELSIFSNTCPSPKSVFLKHFSIVSVSPVMAPESSDGADSLLSSFIPTCPIILAILL